VFFDEFDCAYNGVPLGWLKFFLSPMQDGKFQHEDNMLGIGKSIFVFAGGIASRHEEFSSPTFWDKRFTGVTTKQVFASAKGPDFCSRLRGQYQFTVPGFDLAA
jgi:hypothetical protein